MTNEERRYRLARARAIEWHAFWREWAHHHVAASAGFVMRHEVGTRRVDDGILSRKHAHRAERWLMLWEAAKKRREELRRMP